MRVTKDAATRKSEILDAAESLFISKGYDNTTISDIIEKLKVARGTVYYHFKSKEDVLDALIKRSAEEFFLKAKTIAGDKSIPVMQRLFAALLAMNGNKNDAAEIVKQSQKPQNALMRQKIRKANLLSIPPILMEVVSEGIEAGLFNTPYPYESLEMVVAQTNEVFGDFADDLGEAGMAGRIEAFIYNLERLFGAEPGSFDSIRAMFGPSPPENA